METKNASWLSKQILKTKQTMKVAEYGEVEIMQMPRFSIHKMCKQLRGVFPKGTFEKISLQ